MPRSQRVALVVAIVVLLAVILLPQVATAQCEWCGSYVVDVRPDGESAGTKPANTGGHTVQFDVINIGTLEDWYNFTCSGSGGATCTAISPSSAFLWPWDVRTVTVTYSVGGTAGTGAITLTAWGGDSDSGHYTVNIATYGASVTPDGGGAGTRTAWTAGHSESFTVQNTGSTTNTYSLSCGGSNGITCTGTNTGSVTLGAWASTTVWAYYTVGGPGTGSLTLNASGTNASDGGSYSVAIVSYGVSVTPDGGGAATRTAWTNGHGESFTVYNSGSATNTYSIGCGGSNGVTCTGTSASSVTVGAYSSTSVTAYYNVGAPATGTLTLNASGTNASDGGSFSVPIVSYGVAVTPDGAATAKRAPNTDGHSERFTVHNTGSATNTFSFSCSSSGGLVCDGVPGSVTLGSNATTDVWQSYSTGAPGTGSLTLTASGTNASDAGSYSVPVGIGPSVALVAHNRDNQARSLCWTVAAGSAAMVQCGDLVVAHGMPVYRTLGRDRSLTLVYNSATAAPRVAIAANVGLAGGTAPPDQVYTELRVSGSLVASATYSAWSADETRQIALGFDAMNWNTGAYPFTLLVRNIYGPQGYDTVVSDTLLVVNRATSEFGAGWWLGGVEQLVLGQPGNTILWVGSDGSARVYRPNGTNAWLGAAGAYRDEIVWTGSVYERRLKGGVKVRFDGSGRHVETETRVGHRTAFSWTAPGGATRLTSITVPPAGTGGSYTLGYQGGSQYLDWIDDPAGRRLNTHIDYPTARGHSMTYIQDADLRQVFFGYDGVGRLNSRTDRRGHTTTYQYANGFRVTQFTVPLNASETATATFDDYLDPRVVWGQPGGTFTAGPHVTPWRDVNGPLSGSPNDVTQVWIDRWGAPIQIRDAFSNNTYLTRGDPNVPALVTQVQAPNGFVAQATYDPRGNRLTLREVNPYGNGDPVTRYEYDGTFDFVTKVVPPMLDSTVMAYDGQGNRIWQQDARGSSSRVNFAYFTTGAKAGLVQQITPPVGGTTTFDYDALSNLTISTSGLGFVTRSYQDSMGRPERVETPIDGVKLTEARSYYDVMGRVDSTKTIGPQISYNLPFLGSGSAPAETLIVRTTYNAEGQPLRVERESRPNVAGIGVMGNGILYTEWHYDYAGRDTVMIETGDETLKRYDLAGNVTTAVTVAGRSITMQYDALNRLTQRTVPAVTYSRTHCAADVCIDEIWFPAYPSSGQTGLTVSGRTETFAYDVMGNMTQAWNDDARVTWTYFSNGALQTDRLQIRDYGGTAFTTHDYTLTHSYDQNGRRSTLAPSGNMLPSGGTTQRSAYTSFGALQSVTNLLNNVHSYTYDLGGRLTRLDQPGGYLSWTYDGDSRVTRRDEYFQGGSRWLHGDTFVYDQAGRRLSVGSTGGAMYTTGDYAYSGTGKVAASVTGDQQGRARWEQFTADAMGNVTRRDFLDEDEPVWQAVNTTYNPGGDVDRIETVPPQNGQPNYPTVTANEPDDDRNVGGSSQTSYGYSMAIEDPSTTPPDLFFRRGTRNYYSADGQLRASQWYKDEYNMQYGNRSLWRGAFEEYWYDALGRRILKRVQADALCEPTAQNAAVCQEYIERFVWDGSQLFHEVRRLVDDGATTIQLNASPSAGQYQGWVTYTQTGDIDAPLDLIRIGDNPQVVIPHQSANGAHDVPTDVNGYAIGCMPDASAGCLALDWPGAAQWAYRDPMREPPAKWYGSVVTGQRDLTGLTYRRNRYYDPATGQFTQQDPIGIAGGLNVYGYTSGDPINFHDPFGLKVCFQGREYRRLADSTAEATGTTFGLDKDRCATNVQAAGEATEVSAAFAELAADSSFVVNLIYDVGGSANRAGKVRIDQGDIGRPYGTSFVRPGVCETSRGAVWDEPSIIAHELGHAYVLFKGSGNTNRTAIRWENLIHKNRGRPARSSRCH